MSDKPKVRLTGNDGNAFAVLGACLRAARRAGFPKERIDAISKEMMSGDYDNLLCVAMKHFDVE